MSYPSYTNEPWLTFSRVIETTADLVLLRLTFANPHALPLAMGWYLLHFTAMFLWTELDNTSNAQLPQQAASHSAIGLSSDDVGEAINAADNVDIYQYRLSFLSKQLYKDMFGGLGITTASSLASDQMMKIINITIHPLLITSGFLLIPLLGKLYYNYVYLEDIKIKENFSESLVKQKYNEELELEKALTKDPDPSLLSSLSGFVLGK